ncbi:glycosyl transferase [Paenibacillus sp. PK3_47]|uniref:glycosyltransferase n=1 Tax=Paenibacillus sp. PK3_47 TaxID=2072642 RepID=UPI00201D3823|nr:glycosyltransferase [Paenibacillus sp. PK3_47]UQZ34425.1 glycosyl transferase [Paenibacillus sp. PK3_47]
MSGTVTRVLLGSPVHQKPPVLRQFLHSLKRLNCSGFELDYYFIDDNDQEESSLLLQEFARNRKEVFLQTSGFHDTYVRNDTTHYWNSALVWKVAGFKNLMIRRAETFGYDYLFLVDSDLVLHPDTALHLIGTRKDIISEIFWTQWQPDTLHQPQVWMHDEYNQWDAVPGEKLGQEEINRRFHEFLYRLQQPGIYEVGGLGACTLISRRAIEAGVSYDAIKNVSFWGEDRHFCIRAAALGIPLYVDTHYPALHLYRDSDLSKVDEYLRMTATAVENGEELAAADAGERTAADGQEPAGAEAAPAPQVTAGSIVQVGPKRPKLTLTMVVKNEGSRFLRQVLREHRKYIDEAVIIDDCSTDNTADICREELQGIPLVLVHNTVSKFSNESELRKQQWAEVVKSKPEWILSLDADELFEARFAEDIHSLLQDGSCDLFCFRLYDFWDEQHYREDVYWRSHQSYRPFLLRYREDFQYAWNELPQHCGRLPENIFELPHQLSNLRLKHLGWSRADLRLDKYMRYMQLDPDGQYGWKEQYQSILDQHPRLVPWVE